MFSNVRFSSGSNAIDGRLLNSSGNAITATNYRRAVERVKDTGSFNQFRSTGQNYFDSLGINTTTYPQTGGFELTVYNPFESVYTHVSKRSSG